MEHNFSREELRKLLLEILDDTGVYPPAGDVLTALAGGDVRWVTPAAGGGGGLEWSLLLMGG